jgi:hypothetical protein
MKFLYLWIIETKSNYRSLALIPNPLHEKKIIIEKKVSSPSIAARSNISSYVG